MTSSVSRRAWLTALPPIVAFVALVVALVFVFYVAPRERPEMGEVQRVFYFHVAFAFACLILFVGCALCSLGYLLTRPSPAYGFMAPTLDRLAAAMAEIGVLAGAIVLITGPLWAKPVWGEFWTWEPRLMLMLLTEFLFIGYLVLRAYAARDESGKRLSAGVALIGGPAVYLIHVAVELWGGNHPSVLGEEDGGLAHGDMQITFAVSVGAVLCYAGYLVYQRFEHHRLVEAIESTYLDLSDLEDG